MVSPIDPLQCGTALSHLGRGFGKLILLHLNGLGGRTFNPLQLAIYVVFSRFGLLRTIAMTIFIQSVSRAERQKVCIKTHNYRPFVYFKSFNIIKGVLGCIRALYFCCLVLSWVLKVPCFELIGVIPLHAEGGD